MIISSVNPLFIMLPIVFAQYILATFALVRLARARLSTARYVIWNVVIMVVFFIGAIAFFIYDFKRGKKNASGEESSHAAEKGPDPDPLENGDKWSV